MRKLLFLIVLLQFASCNYFKSQEKQTEKLVDTQLLGIDWNEVESYPLFEDCDESASQEIQRDCFKITMLGYFSDALKDINFEVDKDINEQMYVDFNIDEHGFITIKEISDNEAILSQIPQIKEELSTRLNELTTVRPAHKRGIPVGIRFRLPIVINTTN